MKTFTTFHEIQKSRGDLIEILHKQKNLVKKITEKSVKHIPQLKLLEAASGKYMSRIVSTHVQTISNYPDIYQIPTYLETTIETEIEGGGIATSTRTWALDDKI